MVGKATEESKAPTPPKLVNRRENRNAAFKLGRTIGEKREKLETKNERIAARKKDKQKKAFRVSFTVVGFIILAIILIVLCFGFFHTEAPDVPTEDDLAEDYAPTIEISDESLSTQNKITSRMKKYIGLAEKDLRDLGYTPIRAVIPAGSIREVDIYLQDYPGFIKMTTDRDSAISAEDTDRMLRYLAEQGISEFTYIDVRIDGKAYWK